MLNTKCSSEMIPLFSVFQRSQWPELTAIRRASRPINRTLRSANLLRKTLKLYDALADSSMYKTVSLSLSTLHCGAFKIQYLDHGRAAPRTVGKLQTGQELVTLVWLYSCVNLILKMIKYLPLPSNRLAERPSEPRKLRASSRRFAKYRYSLILSGFLFSLQFYQFKMISFFYNATFNPDIYCLDERLIAACQHRSPSQAQDKHAQRCHQAVSHFDVNQCDAPCVRSNCYTLNRNWITSHCPLPSPSLFHSPSAIFSCISVGWSILNPLRNTLGLCKMEKIAFLPPIRQRRCAHGRFVLVIRFW